VEKNVTVNAILACDDNWGIGNNNDLPWPRNEYDMKWFRENTMDGVVVMGRKTWQSLGNKCLPKRVNCVVSSDISSIEGSPDIRVAGFDSAVLKELNDRFFPKKIWIIGGGQIYKQAIPHCDFVYLTRFHGTYQCDTFFDPVLLDRFVQMTAVQKTSECTFSIWRRL
jgi:dihydrofolate reductase